MGRYRTNRHPRRAERSGRPRIERAPTLRFTPYAWAKLLVLRDLGETEIGGFGITAEDDPLLVEDVELVGQTCTPVTVKFDDAAVADFFDRQVDRGLGPERFARVWAHTHPGDSAEPSGTDEETFLRVFGGCDWAIMFILACGGNAYARLRFGCGPEAEISVPVRVEYGVPFPAADVEGWQAEYAACVKAVEMWRPPAQGQFAPDELEFWEEHPELLEGWQSEALGLEPLSGEGELHDDARHDDAHEPL